MSLCDIPTGFQQKPVLDAFAKLRAERDEILEALIEVVRVNDVPHNESTPEGSSVVGAESNAWARAQAVIEKYR